MGCCSCYRFYELSKRCSNESNQSCVDKFVYSDSWPQFKSGHSFPDVSGWAHQVNGVCPHVVPKVPCELCKLHMSQFHRDIVSSQSTSPL